MSLPSLPEIVARVEGRVGRLTLNRPKALNALTEPMSQALTAALLAWRADDDVDLVLIDHAGERGFCAGGDIRAVAASGAADGAAGRAFFHVEYRLNDLLRRYPKPVAAIMDGVTMGGGVGLSIYARHRVATERTLLAMPETGIGLFPDIGAGWFLLRLPGQTGLWMALTGARLRAADAVHLGLCTHYVESHRLDALKAALIVDPAAAEQTLAAHAADPGPAPVATHQGDIDRWFGAPSVEAIVAGLAADGSDWARAHRARTRLLRRGNAPRIPPRQPHPRLPGFSGRRARRSDRQGSCPALAPGDTGGGGARRPGRPVRAVCG
jgi:enoyl-CoA hydratase